MNRFLWTLFLAFIIINGSDGYRVTFCDIETTDNVFNIGKTIHFLRCGRVWTYDPSLHMNSWKGGFTRDYSWFHLARRHIGSDIVRNNKAENRGANFNNEMLRYTGFSIQGLECENWWFDLRRDCVYSAQQWNTFSMIASNKSVLVFRYNIKESDNFKFTNDSGNPLGMQDHNTGLNRSGFWPYLSKLAPEFQFKEVYPKIHSLLFVKRESRLYVAMYSPDEKYKCITHINMKKMLFDTRQWPKNLPRDYIYEWAPAVCYSGNLVGMFEKSNKTYIVGKILPDSREYEDQIYSLNAVDMTQVIIEPIYTSVKGFKLLQNLRTFFNCPINESLYLNSTTQPGGPIQSRKLGKRSVDESEPFLSFKWEDITKEVKNDWIQLSLMSSFAIFLIYRLLK